MITTYVCDKCAGRNCIVSEETEKGFPAFCCVFGRPNAGDWHVAGKSSGLEKEAGHDE